MITELSPVKRHALCAAATLAGLAGKSDIMTDVSNARIYQDGEYAWFDVTYEGKQMVVRVETQQAT